MTYKPVLDIVPSHPIEPFEEWRIQRGRVHGVEHRMSMWQFPKREWNVTWTNKPNSVMNALRNFFNGIDGPLSSFFFREPVITSRAHVRIGEGDGYQRTWVFPATGYAFHATFVNSSEMAQGVDYDILPGAAQNGFDILSFRSAVTSGSVVWCNYTDGYFLPIVRAASPFSPSIGAILIGSVDMTLRETMEDYPDS